MRINPIEEQKCGTMEGGMIGDE
jgi:hypothetical protein